MDLRQSLEYGKYMESQGWIVPKNPQIFIRKIPLTPFCVLKLQRFTQEPDWKKLENIKKRYRVIYSVLEPDVEYNSIENLRRKGYRLNNSPYLPTKTLVVDLSKSKENLWSGLSKDARQRVKSISRGLAISETNNLEEFREEWKKCKRGYVPGLKNLINLKKIFGDKVWFLEVRKEKNVLAGTMILLVGKTAYYYFAWTSEEGKNVDAQYHLVWEAMNRSRKSGYKSFDFEGIYDERWPINKWRGFSMFKKKFGGVEIAYPGSYVRWF